MKLFKIYIILFTIVLAFVAISRFFPPSYTIRETIVVDKPLEETFTYMSDLKKWEEWSLWNKSTDSSLIFFYNSKYDTLNGRLYFAGNLMGKGFIEIVTYSPNRAFAYRLKAAEGDRTANGVFEFRAVSDTQTEIAWLDSGNVGNNPIKRYMIPIVTKSTHEAFQQGLQKIKLEIEKK